MLKYIAIIFGVLILILASGSFIWNSYDSWQTSKIEHNLKKEIELAMKSGISRKKFESFFESKDFYHIEFKSIDERDSYVTSLRRKMLKDKGAKGYYRVRSQILGARGLLFRHGVVVDVAAFVNKDDKIGSLEMRSLGIP